MKKVLTIAAVFMLVLALSISAFAAPSPEVGPDKSEEQENGDVITMKGLDGSQLRDKDGLDGLVEQSGLDPNNLRYVACDISCSRAISGRYTFKITLDVPFKLGLLAHYHNGKWIPESFKQNGSTVEVTTENGMSPFVFVYDTSAPAPVAEAPADNAPAPVGPQKSPQTGYNTVLWIVLAAAMVSLAGYCFVSARKKTQE